MCVCTLLLEASSGTPLAGSDEEAAGGHRSTPSAFLTHVSTNLGPVRPLALLMVCNFNTAWCRHVAFGHLMPSYKYNLNFIVL